MESDAAVTLLDIDEPVLEEMVVAATTDARGDEVTPPVSPGSDWTPERIAWLREIHRNRREGIDGPIGEATWAIAANGRVVGAIRLKLTTEPGVFETGIWLTQGARGRGVATQAVAAVLTRAFELGARAVRADTTASNAKAIAVLTRLGFELEPPDADGAISAIAWLPSDGGADVSSG